MSASFPAYRASSGCDLNGLNQGSGGGLMIVISDDERRKLLRLAYRFCWDEHDAEDALQSALLKATQAAEQLRQPQNRWSWLCRIVIQHCWLAGRKSQRDSARITSHQTESCISSDSPSTPAALGALLQKLIRTLPERQRVAMTLKHIEQMHYREIAEIMDVRESTVRAYVHDGREALRLLITSEYPEWQP